MILNHLYQKKLELQRLTELVDQGFYDEAEATKLTHKLELALGVKHPQLQRLKRSVTRQRVFAKMRHIAKKECTFKPLNIANLSPPKTSQDATLKWKEFRWHKQKLLKLLLREQHSVCCYSEIDAKEHGFRYHIEHVMNKSEYPLHTFDYKNLAASALADDDIKSIKANGFGSAFGGHAHGKSKTVDTRLFVIATPQGLRALFFLSFGWARSSCRKA
ncbi:hypothetical protein PPS11_01689 [Pseudomonas putida S11]|nr:hypothetical protein PPS11_01689 [Pseudomonas putida S11]